MLFWNVIMRNCGKILFFIGLQLFSSSIYAQPISLKSLQFDTTSKQNRMIFDVTASPQHRVFVMDNPSRLVIDISNAHLEHSLAQPSIEHPLFNRVRVGVRNNTDLRIVVDLKAPISAKQFSLNSNNNDPHRLIVDLDSSVVANVVNNNNKQQEKTENVDSSEVEIKTITQKTTGLAHAARIIIAIDPGHGGNDPGAHGIQGTEEKVITFAIAKKLEALIVRCLFSKGNIGNIKTSGE